MDAITPESLAAQLAATPWEQQSPLLRAVLAARWQPQLAAHLDHWARLGLARLRAAQQGRGNPRAAGFPLYNATVWIAPVWPGDDAPPEPPAVPPAAPLTAPERIFRLSLAAQWEEQLNARLDFWTSDTLSKVRATPELALAAAALAPLLAAGVEVAVEWPDA